jgi:hypothetical protein
LLNVVQPPLVRHRLIALLGLVLAGCSAPDAKQASEPPLAAPSALCEDNIDVDTVRAGAHGVAWLLYSCDGNACNGEESFTRGIRHAVSFEVAAGPEAALLIESSDPSVAQLADLASAFDPCAQKIRGWATIDARAAGRATLSIRDAAGELDTIEIAVADPDSIRLRTTLASAFAFERPDSTLLVTEGDSWLLLPELFDASGELLLGVPELTWEVDDPQVAELHTAAVDADSALVPELSAFGTARLEAKNEGETELSVRANNGARASLRLRVVRP